MTDICHDARIPTLTRLGKLLSPLQGLKILWTINPGRCPGLSSVGLAALSISVHQRSSAVEKSLRPRAFVSLRRGELRSFAANESTASALIRGFRRDSPSDAR